MENIIHSPAESHTARLDVDFDVLSSRVDLVNG